MSAATLYDDRVMDHIRNARNYRALDDADRRGEAVSQVCGDSVTVYLKLNGTHITGIGFQCVSCGICMASASMMTELVTGRTIEEAQALLAHCATTLEGGVLPAPAGKEGIPLSPEQQAVFATLQAFPSRKTCAWVGWAALSGALRDDPAPQSL